jgi:alkylation response protein AidB-like acyl-CoA dehydrogenase
METQTQGRGGAFLLGAPDPRAVFVPEMLTEEDLLIGRTAADFLRQEVLPRVEAIESGDHALMAELMRKAGALGLLGADVPECYGGLGLSQTTCALIAEKLNPQQSFALTHEAHTVIATLPLLYFGTHEQKSRCLPKLASGEWIGSFALSEANSGSDALAMQTRASLSPDGRSYLLRGEKMWITNTAFADLFTVFAKVDGSKVTAFLVERDSPGLSFGKEEHKLGMHGTSTRRLILEDVPVPVENALEVGKGHYAAFCALNLGRLRLEAGAVGGLKSLLATCAAYAKQRKTFGRAIAEYGLIQHKLAEMAVRTFALESMVYRLAHDMEELFSSIEPTAADAPDRYHRATEEYSIECSIVKVIGSESYSVMADEAIQIHGGYGYTEEFTVARTWRDQRLLRIGEGANEIVRLAIVTTLLRRDKAGRLTALDAGRRLTGALMRAELPDGDLFDNPLDALGALSRDVTDAALFLLHQATEQLGDGLLESQEIVAALADLICYAYCLQSVSLRCRRLSAAPPARFDAMLLTAEAAGQWLGEEANRAARYALDSMPGFEDSVDWRDEPFTGIRNLLDRLIRRDTSPAALRRAVAAVVIDRDGYPF